MPTLNDIRQQYPQYNDMPDVALADAIYTKFYTDMPRAEFDAKLGLSKPDVGLGKAIEGTIFGDIVAGVTAPGRALQGEYNAEPPENPGFISETDIARQRMAATRMEGDAFKLGTIATLGTTGGPAGALGTGMTRPKPITAKPPLPSTTTPAELIKAGGEGFDAFRASKAAINPDDVVNYVHQARTTLANKGLPTSNAKQVHDALDNLMMDANRAQQAGGVMLPENMSAFRTTLVNDAKSIDGNVRGAAGMAKSDFDDWLQRTLPAEAPVLADAVANTRVGHLAADIAKPLNRANLSASAANSGMNQENRLRQVFTGLLAKEEDKLARGRKTNYDPAVHALLRDLVEGTRKDNLRRTAGNILGGGGGIAAGAYGLTGLLSNPLIATAPIIGAIIKSAGNRATLAKVDEISRLVMSGAPLVKGQAAQVNTQITQAMNVVRNSQISEAKKSAMLQALQSLRPDKEGEK